MTAKEHITLREYLEAETRHLEEIGDLRQQLNDKALELAKAITDAHFQELNQHAKKTEEERSHFLPREIFEQWRRTVFATAVALLGAAIGAVMVYLK